MTATESWPTAAFTTEGHTPVLIEDWLPIRELGIESAQRESNPRPPLNGLHVWWARAPLAAANGVQLAALLPVWEEGLIQRIEGLASALQHVRDARQDLVRRRPPLTEADWYRAWVLWLCGVRGDTVRVAAEILAAKATGVSLGSNPYGYRPAFNNKPSVDDLNVLHRLLVDRWGRVPAVIDPTAGGGAIPYSAMRYGLPTYANDLNPVAISILDATLVGAARFGRDIVGDVEKWGGELVRRCRERLSPFFELSDPDERITAYLFANTVVCPRTGGPVPLAPNWWLDKAAGGTAVLLRPVRDADGSPSHVEFDIVKQPRKQGLNPDDGTVSGGDGISSWDGLVIDGEHIKAEAQAGRMWPTLYAVAARKPKGKRGWNRYFRAPDAIDLSALSAAEDELGRHSAAWKSENVLPDEDLPAGSKTSEPLRYGMSRWADMFSPRQLLVHGVFVEEWRRLCPEVRESLGEHGDGVMAVLGLMQGKAANWNSRLASWNVGAQGLRSTFDRHDFAFKWSFAEFEGASSLWEWTLSSLVDKYQGVVGLLEPAEGGRFESPLEHRVPSDITLSSGSASVLTHLGDESIECVNIDPPYYDNVQYAELADFFYVWMKRTLGLLRPERFTDDLTNKEDEAVANTARFADAGRRKKELATFDYQQKMQAIFAECHRVLKPDGVMTVWFTHKRAEAWDTLGTAMMDAGFTVEASWPIATQPQTSLHHAAKNSAKSTVILVCRKRRFDDGDGVFFEDIEADVRQAARRAVAKFEADVGVGGVDLLLATYGPTLSVISRRWPVLSSEASADGRARRLKPEEALAVARQEVARLRMKRLVGREAQFDHATDFWLIAWETFRAREFPYDEARKLALGVGYDVEAAFTKDLLTKKSENVTLSTPSRRGRRLRREAGDDGRLDTLVDAVHHMLNIYETDGLSAARTWLSDSGYEGERSFVDAVQAAVRAIPRIRDKSGFTLDEARLLDEAVLALFGDEVELPKAEEEARLVEQTTLDV